MVDAPVPPETLERIAEAVHRRFLANQAGRKPADDPAMRPWEQLADGLKDSCRRQAEDIPAKLALLGYRLVPAGQGAALPGFTAEELEQLAIHEHDRWVAERRAAGWTAGPARDVERKVTPFLVPWEALSEEIREYDRDAVRAIPDLLRLAGMEVRRG
jgi:hypothetical protein